MALKCPNCKRIGTLVFSSSGARKWHCVSCGWTSKPDLSKHGRTDLKALILLAAIAGGLAFGASRKAGEPVVQG